MLHEFLRANHDELIRRCRTKVIGRSAPGTSPARLEYGIPDFLSRLTDALRAAQSDGVDADGNASGAEGAIGSAAAKHGVELLHGGYTVAQVVHDYGDLCQAVTELAQEKHQTIAVDDFHTFNRCLDNAMADAVTAFGHRRDAINSASEEQSMNERLGFLAHELRNHLNTAMLAFHSIKSGSVALTGATGAVLDRSLLALRNLIDRSLADVRLSAGLKIRAELIPIRDLIEEVQVGAELDAQEHGLTFSSSLEDGLWVNADRPMLSSALSNLLQNAFKFTHAHGHVTLNARASGERVIIDVEDECGGLPKGKSDELFESFAQQGSDRTGLGLGLAISRRGVEANGGTLRVHDVAGKGCIFTIELPRHTPTLSAQTPS
ncbi:MAG: HAMP domain-containing histidine kinase [Sandaracinaceae bacterium]|nr:HAMP domain-containing histidine kinase [Sandaracinaceae bacterium]